MFNRRRCRQCGRDEASVKIVVTAVAPNTRVTLVRCPGCDTRHCNGCGHQVLDVYTANCPTCRAHL